MKRYRDTVVDQVLLLVSAGDEEGLARRLDALAEEILEPARSF